MPWLGVLVRGRFSRDLWGVVALLFALVLAGSVVAIRLAVDREERDALSRAGTVADSAIAPLLSRDALQAALEGPEAEPLRAAVREAVLADPRIVRVRIWRPDGTLLFSTDPRDDVGRVIPPIDVRITDAVEGTPGAGVSEPGETRRGLAHDAEPVLRTFVPLTVEGPPPAAAAEIDFRHADLVAAASAPWRPAQVAMGAGLALALALLAVSLRAGAPGAVRAPSGPAPGGPEPRRAPSPRAEEGEGDAVALARKLKQAEARIGALQGEIALLTNQLRRAAMERADGRPVPGVAQAIREAEEALARANERAEQAEARAGRAEARAREATAEAERARAEARAAAEAVAAAEARASAAERQRAGLEEELRRAQAELAESRARLDEAAGAVGGDAAATGELRTRAEEAEERAREAEERAREAEERAREAEERLRGALAGAQAAEELAARLRDTEDRLALAERQLAERGTSGGDGGPSLASLEERLRAAEARARRAEQLLEELQLSLSTASLRPEAGELREKLARAGSTRHRHEGQEPEAAIRGAIIHELRSALAGVLGSSLTLKAAVATPEGQEALRHLHATTRRLDRLVQDLEDAPRLVDGSLPLRRRRTDLEALVQRVVGEAEGLQQMVVELSTREAKATVDAARVEQILEAILETVRTRAAPGSTIRVVVSSEEEGARISVEDPGPVPASLPRELALAARLAELHGGRLWAEERPGGGTAFRLSLPERAPEESGATPAPQGQARPQTGRGSTA